jgi:hypothetical protein
MEDPIIAGVAHDSSEAKITVVGVPDQPIGSLVAAAVQKVKALCAGEGC